MGLKVKKRKRALDKPGFSWYCSGAIFPLKGVHNLLKDKNKKNKTTLLIIVCALVFIPLLTTVVLRMEGEQPAVQLDLSSLFIGMDQDLDISLVDHKSGLKRFWVAILQDGKETTLFEKDYPSTGILQKGTIQSETIRIHLAPKKDKLKDGKAILRLMTVDYSWRSWGKGNRTYAEKEVIIDTTPPMVKALTHAHNVSPGGSGLVAYELSEPCDISGVQVGDQFFPGYSASDLNKKNQTWIAFFALNNQQRSGTEIYLMAKDRAGNQTRSGFPHYIKTKRFKKDTIRISDTFINSKLSEFEEALAGQVLDSPLDKFLFINRQVREKNKGVLNQLMRQSDATRHWDGTFLRLPKSATRSGFGDRRTYRYQGKTIDHQTHLGIDLASISMSPVPAANSGKVVYADKLGIYGRLVVIDHGYGLFSMYAHLSSFHVQVGQMVHRGDIIGNTGKTGLAGGDHLHYSVLVSGTFVDPLEWWDASWIHNNITSKIDMLGRGE
jgi:murein DD-endopeptidase MepM/ murein hydrolase activator NlpD